MHATFIFLIYARGSVTGIKYKMKYTYNVSIIHSKHNTGIFDFCNNMDITTMEILSTILARASAKYRNHS